MKKQILLIIYLIILLGGISSRVVNGSIDLTSAQIDKNKPIPLSGNWFITTEDSSSKYSKVPGQWKEDTNRVKYRLNILSEDRENFLLTPKQVNSQYTLYLNGVKIWFEDQYRVNYIPITLKKGLNILELDIINKNDPVGGIRNTPFIGSSYSMLKMHEENFIRDSFFSGASLIISIFFLILFFNSKTDRYNLYFSLLCLALTIRGLVINEKLIFYLLPEISGYLVQKLEYICVYSLPCLFILFVKNYFTYNPHKKLLNLISLVTGLFPIIAIFFPGSIYKYILFPYFLTGAITIFFVIILLIIYVRMKLKDSFKLLISLIFISTGAFYDISLVLFNTKERHIMSITLMLFILFMLYNIFRNEILNIEKNKVLTQENIKINKYLYKFVPISFFKTVGLGDLLTIKKGDGVEKKMTIIFATIVDFQKYVRVNSAEYSIDLLNRYYAITSPIIKKHNGFIDKFIDETMMALFPGSPEDGINAMIEINKAIIDFNKTNKGQNPIVVRAGIHLGNQYIGIVGDNKRVDATVISSVVNTASRISSFTNKIDKNILISESVYNEIKNKSIYNLMFMGRVKLKGKIKYIGIYSVNTSEPTEADKLFSLTMQKLNYSPLYELEGVLTRIKSLYKYHTPTNYYLGLIYQNKKLEDNEK